MSNFLTILPRESELPDARLLFEHGLQRAQQLKSQTPRSLLQLDCAHAASFARLNGTGGNLVTDPCTDSWLIAIGSWFLEDGSASGAEEHLLQRYLEVGANQLGRELEGFFTLVIGDGRTRETLVITDLLGSCHAFMRVTDKGVALSGSSLLLAGLANFTLDEVACQEFLRLGVIYQDRTCFNEVRKLGSASVYRFAVGALIEQQRYWEIGEVETGSIARRELAAVLWASLLRVTRKISGRYDRLVCDLTGGYDSRILVGAFLGAGASFSTTVSGASDSADVRVSSELAQLFGLAHEIQLPVQGISYAQLVAAVSLTDGAYNAVEYARVMQIHQHLSRRFDISLNGSFGEIARGYWWELLFPHIGALKKLDAEMLARQRFAAPDQNAALFPEGRRVDLASHFTKILSQLNANLSGTTNTLQMDNSYIMLRMQSWQGRIASSTNQIWPCLSPMMFRTTLEVMLAAQPAVRKRSGLVREMLAKFQPGLAQHPMEHGYPAMPATLVNLHRFWPVIPYYSSRIWNKLAGKYLRGSGATSARVLSQREILWQEDAVRETLNPDTMKLATILDQAALVKFIEDSRKPEFAYTEQWCRLLTLEIALRRLDEGA